MRAMLVAAGFGTRLDPLTRELPKPALPVANRPAAFFACDHLARSGFTDIVVNTHYLPDRLRAALEPFTPEGVTLRFVHETEILGTGGGVRNAWRPLPGEDFVTFNAKLLFAPDIARALRVHRERSAIATMVLRPLPAGTRFEPVEIDRSERVRRIRGLPAAPGEPLEQRVYTGVQVLAARAFDDLPRVGDIMEHAYLRWLARGEVIASVTDSAPWMDIGVTPRHYLEANLALAEGRVVWPGLANADVAGVTGSIVAPDVALGAGVQLDRVVLGAGASVAPGARLSRVVAWPNARIDVDLADAIVTSSGQVVRV